MKSRCVDIILGINGESRYDPIDATRWPSILNELDCWPSLLPVPDWYVRVQPAPRVELLSSCRTNRVTVRVHLHDSESTSHYLTNLCSAKPESWGRAEKLITEWMELLSLDKKSWLKEHKWMSHWIIHGLNFKA